MYSTIAEWRALMMAAAFAATSGTITTALAQIGRRD